MPNKIVEELIRQVASMQADVGTLKLQMNKHLDESKPIVEALATLKNNHKWLMVGLSFLAGLGALILGVVLHK